MKSMIKNRLLLVTAICFLFAGTSCQYDEIVDIPYPESLVYLPIAVNGSISPDGIYTIEEGASTAWVSPTPGQPMKYTVRNADNAFVIPLGIYRSGTGKTIKGSVNVSVALDFLRKDAPKKYAMGIVISDENNRVNKQLNTGIILIDTKITIPVATFTTQLDGSSFDTFVFTNSSLYWDFFSGEEPFSWDFGDGSAISHEINPKHQYGAVGDYNVTLTVRGITGETVTVTNTVSVKSN